MQLLQVQTPADGLVAAPFGPLRKLAGDQRGGQKGEQRDPVLRRSDGESVDGRKEEEVVTGGGRQRRHDRFQQAPFAGNDQNRQQVDEAYRGGINGGNERADERIGRHGRQHDR